MIDNAFNHLNKEIDGKVRQLEEHLGCGGAKNWDEYQGTCGEIKGLLTARLYIQDLHERLRNSDDD